MQRVNDRRGCHTAGSLVHTAGARLAAGGLITYLAATISAPGAAAETLDAVYAGNGGTSTTSATTTLAAGDICGGGNNGNTIMLGDRVPKARAARAGPVPLLQVALARSWLRIR
jgi:hypothetical protein